MMDSACFVIGHPIAHSRSPLIHGHWLEQHGIAGSYSRIDVAPADLPAFVQRLRAGEFRGGNVTVPHKQAVLPLVDRLSDTARMLGAVNTLYRDGGLICGDNTDAAGFIGHLDASVPGWRSRTGSALVLGAGGAALAIVHGLMAAGVARIGVANRDPARALALIARLGQDCAPDGGPHRAAIAPVAWAERSAHVAGADLIVNTTSLGMAGQPPLEIDLDGMRPGTIVDDIVYVPLETALLGGARARGGVPVDGLGMLLNQAVPGFERWFGLRPLVTPALRHLLEADIQAGQR